MLATPNLLSNPNWFQDNVVGSEGYVINLDGSLDSFSLSNPSSLITSDVVETSLPPASAPVSISAFTPASGIASIFIPQAGTNSIAALNANTAALYDTVGIEAGGSDPYYVVGTTNAPRVYAISQNLSGGANCSAGQVDSIETISTASLADSAQICVGSDPVYGVMTPSTFRAFILNKGSGTVSVINVPSNTLDTLPSGVVPSGTPVGTIPLPTTFTTGTSTVTEDPSPVWADFNTIANELVVLNQGANGSNGSLSIISIPLCNYSALSTNPNCSSVNPADAANFGQILATVPVGIDPTMVSVLQGINDNAPAAYVINTADNTCGTSLNSSGAPVQNGSVTVVNLQSYTVQTTICSVSGTAAQAAAAISSNIIYGIPNSVAATSGQPTGKVYVTSSDSTFMSTYMSVIYTDTNTVVTHIPLQGNGVRVMVTQP